MTDVEYNGKKYTLPIVFDDYTSERDRLKDDFVEGLFLYDAVMCFAESDMGVVPKKNVRIKVSGKTFEIKKVSTEMGEVILYLEQFSE